MITEDLEKFVAAHPDEFFTSRLDEADFWIRAFVDEVRKRALQGCVKSHSSTAEHACNYSIGETLNELSRELLGEEKT